MRIKGVPLPSGMGLSEFLKKSKEGAQDAMYGSLANPHATDIAGRSFVLDKLNNFMNLENFPGNQLTSTDVIQALNAADYGNSIGRILQNANPNNTGDDLLMNINALEDASYELGLPMKQVAENPSSLTNSQLLTLLSNTQPQLYSALTESTSEPDSIIDNWDLNNARDTIGRGYDPDLILETADSLTEDGWGPDNQDILRALENTSLVADNDFNQNKLFPSDFSPYVVNKNDIINHDTGEITSMRDENYFSPDNLESPAVLSAEFFNSLSDEDLLKQAILNDSYQIGDSDYTIGNLKANGMSDEQLLEFLRNLTNKGYKI